MLASDMKELSYIPLRQSDLQVQAEADAVVPNLRWSSGICACFDDMQSCCVGLFCPCYLFAKNAEYLDSGTLMGPCAIHCVLWGLVNTVCCVLTDGVLFCLPGCFVACYGCRYRRDLRKKYNLEEAPCGDLVTHLCCHLCAICQEYREIKERSSNGCGRAITVAPSLQRME